MIRTLLCVLTLAFAASPVAPAFAQAPATASEPAARPIVIAHRGASGYRPEHTEAAYRLAIAQGADYIEPDLVMTRDGVLVARHENEIGRSTDVGERPEFADRRTTRVIDGETFTGWFAEDFTFAEIRTLRARERNPQLRPGSAGHDGEQPILSLDEIIGLAKYDGQRHGREIGLYIELKNPDYHASIGLPMEQALVDALDAAGLNRRDAPVYIQSFWPQALARLRPLTPVRLTFLVNSVSPPEELLRAHGIARWSDVYSADGLRHVATFADVVGPETELVIPRDAQGRSRPVTPLVADAHAAGLEVHVWSINAENPHLAVDMRCGDPGQPGYEARLGKAALVARTLFEAGVDGVFTDHPDIVLGARDGVDAPLCPQPY